MKVLISETKLLKNAFFNGDRSRQAIMNLRGHQKAKMCLLNHDSGWTILNIPFEARNLPTLETINKKVRHEMLWCIKKKKARICCSTRAFNFGLTQFLLCTSFKYFIFSFSSSLVLERKQQCVRWDYIHCRQPQFYRPRLSD